MEEESKRDQEKNKYDNKVNPCSITSKKTTVSEGEQRKEALTSGCSCTDIIKFVFCGFVCCKNPSHAKNLTRENNQSSGPNLQDVNKNQFEKVQEEVVLESNEKTKLLSDIDHSHKEQKFKTSINRENLCEKVEEEEISSKSNDSKTATIKEEESSISESSDHTRKSPEGSERRHSKGLDAETQVPTPKRIFKQQSVGHLQQSEKGEMVATAIGTNDFYTLVSEVGLI